MNQSNKINSTNFKEPLRKLNLESRHYFDT